MVRGDVLIVLKVIGAIIAAYIMATIAMFLLGGLISLVEFVMHLG